MAIDKNELINKAKDLLKNEMSEIAFNTWIKPIEISKVTNNAIYLKATSKYQIDFIETRYQTLIENTFKYITNKSYEVYIINESDDENPQNQTNKNAESEKNRQSLNPKYTFQSFVVGNNNRLAHAASQAVAKNPAKSYNPLFLYGGVGLGKTHLMHAIGNKALSINPNLNVLYVTSEKFTNQLINAIQENKNEIFRNKYRNIDILLIDDIQFIAGKDRVQEEFFHTFNTLHDNGKQIILSSDKPPRDISLLENRLISRFEWGLLADISCPDYETRLAILRNKVQEENLQVDNTILSNIAEKIDSNIRELEGVYRKLVARASLLNTPITIELAENIINEFKSESEKSLSSTFIKETVSKYFNIDVNDLASDKRSSEIAFPRQVAMYLCRSVANMSFPKIGEDFGNRDHSTVMHAYKKIEKEINTKTSTKLIVESVKNFITKDKENP